MMAGSSDIMDVCSQSTAVNKLPNSLIDVCLIYGVDEKTSGSLLHSSGEVNAFIQFQFQ